MHPAPHPTAKLAKTISILTMVVTTALVLLLYGIYFDSFSESALVTLSFVWVNLFGFGLGGLIVSRRGIGWSVGIGFVAALALDLALFTFFLVLWPML
ncbi:MAG: hypothetical protein U0176_05745 [Bacteroidia bacterium]